MFVNHKIEKSARKNPCASMGYKFILKLLKLFLGFLQNNQFHQL